MIPDWQLPPGVDRGLHDYMRSAEMVAGYDAMMAASPLASLDVRFCQRWFAGPGRVIDLGCGTGRLAAPMVVMGHEYVGVDLSEEMIRQARLEGPHPVAARPPSPSETVNSVDGGRGLEESRSRIGSGSVSPLPPSRFGTVSEGEGPGVRAISFHLGNLVDAATLPAGPFDYAACLFSTLGMIRGDAHRRTAVENVAKLLEPGGVFVLHVHNRYFRGLGLKGVRSGDITMSQSYGGAPLTLHHFGRLEAVALLKETGFAVREVLPVGVEGELRRPWLFPTRRAYGYLIAAERR